MRVRKTTAASAVVIVAIVIGMTARLRAQAPARLDVAPSAVPQGTAPPLKLTASKGLIAASKINFSDVVKVRIADHDLTGDALHKAADSLIIEPPALDVNGEVRIHALDANGRELGLAIVRYGPAADDNTHWWLLLVYVLLLGGFIASMIIYDLRRGYDSQAEVRAAILHRIPSGSLTDGQLTTLVSQMQQAPAGTAGLARTTIAFALLMIIGIAIFHIIATCQTCGQEVPPIVDRTLTLLAGALTSITGFYFGTRAAQGDDGASKAPGATPPASPSTDPTITPPQAKPGDDIVINGSGFGNDIGTVLIGAIAADTKGMAWNDTRIKLTVPKDARSGPAPVTITRADGHQISIAPKAFTVLTS